MNRLTICFLACASFGFANTFNFVTAANAVNPSDSQPVDVFASITTGTNSITITLTNLEVNPTAVSQLISGFDFNLTSSGQIVTGLTANATGTLIDASNWSATPVIDSSDTINHWKYSSSGASNTAIALSSLGGGPADLIIGNPGSGGTYTHANGSLNNCHACPLILHDATFTLAINGVTSSTNINTSSVKVLFGTEATGETVNMVSQAPEPGSLTTLLIGAGFVGLGVIRRRAPSKAAVVAQDRTSHSAQQNS